MFLKLSMALCERKIICHEMVINSLNIFFGPVAVAGRALWVRVHPSVLLSFWPEVFLGLAYYFFSETQHGVRGLCCVVCARARFFEKKICPPPQMQFFLHLVYKEGVYYLLYSCTNPMLEKNLVPGDMGKNVLCQSDCRISKSTLSLKQNNERVRFFARSYIFIEIRSWLKNIEMGMVKHGCGHFGHRTQTLTVSQEGINRINWLFVCW